MRWLQALLAGPLSATLVVATQGPRSLAHIGVHGAIEPRALGISASVIADSHSVGSHPSPGPGGHDGRFVTMGNHLAPEAMAGNETERMNPFNEDKKSADIWNSSTPWLRIEAWHPAGVISNVEGRQVVWSDVGYMSLRALIFMPVLAYPLFLLFFTTLLAVLLGMCLQKTGSSEIACINCEGNIAGPDMAAGALLRSVHATRTPDVPDTDHLLYEPLAALIRHALSAEHLTQRSRFVYGLWKKFCATLPCVTTFGLPLAVACCSRSFPQEVFITLKILTVSFVFCTGMYMIVFAGLAVKSVENAMKFDYGSLVRSEPGERHEACYEVQGHEANVPEPEVVHWVLLPQFKEDEEVVSMTLRSIGQSPGARTSICILLAMEQREAGAEEKAERLRRRFGVEFLDIFATYHPADLPNDPAGKASNTAWAFKELVQHLQMQERDLSRVVMTVADADSDFHRGYFDALQHLYREAGEDCEYRIWQSAVIHLKNYHRQPAPVVAGTFFTAMSELACLADPNAVRFPYSTYSLSLNLARRVGGWDPEWIAEDWHMGIKCFMLTLGRCRVQPVMLPTLNYTPEDCTWWSTIMARWSQAKRHSLGFSDLSYYFMMLPLVFRHVKNSEGKMGPRSHELLKMIGYGFLILTKLSNVHIILGVSWFYNMVDFVLVLCMKAVFEKDRLLKELLDNMNYVPWILAGGALVAIALCTLHFMKLYSLVKKNVETDPGPMKIPFRWDILHWLYLIACLQIFGIVFFAALTIATWRSALLLFYQRGPLEYEVAAKPTKDNRL